MKDFLLYIWQLPQNLLGALLLIFFEPDVAYEWNGVLLNYSPRMRGGISLGRYIILRGEGLEPIHRPVNEKEYHEYGHCRQSKMLGPLYLLVVGIPSLVHAMVWKKTSGSPYYDYWTEKWADRLGGVQRDEKAGL